MFHFGSRTMTRLIGADFFHGDAEREGQRMVRADGTRPIKSQRFLFHQKRRIEASDQLARKRWQACWVKAGNRN
jgi:hypothetical protein